MVARVENNRFVDLDPQATERLRQAQERITELEAKIARLEAEVEPDSVLKLDNDRHIAAGWFYVAKSHDGAQVVDISGDIVDDPRELEDAAYAFTLDHRNGRVNHNGEPIAKLVESVVFTPDKVAKMGLTGAVPVGWWGAMRIYDDGVWERLKSGELSAFSIGGKGRRKAL